MRLAFSIAALVLEVAGLGLILRETIRLRRDELGHVGALRRLWREVQATVRNPAPVEVQGRSGGASASGGQITVTVGGPSDPLEALRARVDKVEADIARAFDHTNATNAAMSDRVDGLATFLEGRISTLEDTRRADLARSSRNERAGVILFGLGLVAGFLANIT